MSSISRVWYLLKKCNSWTSNLLPIRNGETGFEYNSDASFEMQLCKILYILSLSINPNANVFEYIFVVDCGIDSAIFSVFTFSLGIREIERKTNKITIYWSLKTLVKVKHIVSNSYRNIELSSCFSIIIFILRPFVFKSIWAENYKNHRKKNTLDRNIFHLFHVYSFFFIDEIPKVPKYQEIFL